MKKIACLLMALSVFCCASSIFAAPADIKEVYNGATNSVEDLYGTGGMSNDHKTVIVSKIAEIDGSPVNGSGVNILSEYAFDNDSTLPWADCGSVGFSVAGKYKNDGVYIPATSPNLVYFEGVSNGDNTGKVITTFQFDVYSASSSNVLRIWPAGRVNDQRPGFNLKSDGTVGLVHGYDGSDSTFTTKMPLNTWINCAVEYDVTNAVATLYMDGTEVYSLPMTGRTYTPRDFSINCSGSIYMDNIYFYEGGYVQNYGIDEVVYLDQSVSAYSTALEIIFNQELEEGYYQAKMGTVGDTSNTEVVNFIVGNFKVDPKDKLRVLSEAEAYGTDEGQTWYKKSFSKTVSFGEYNSFKSIKLISADGTRCLGAIDLTKNYASDNTNGYDWDRTSLSGDGDITVALQIYAIPDDAKGFSLYFSTESVKPR